SVAAILRRLGSGIALHGKDVLPMAGEYSTAVVLDGVRAFLSQYGVVQPGAAVDAPGARPVQADKAVTAHHPPEAAIEVLPPMDQTVHPRPPGLCTGCPERPIFTAIKLVERELGTHHISADIGCQLFSILPPFELGNTTMGYGLGGASAAALNVAPGGAPAAKRAISVMGDGGFWHNGLTSGVANAVFNRSDNLTIIVDNNYT